MQKLLSRAAILYFLFMLALTAIFFALNYFGYSFVVSYPIVWFAFNVLVEGAFLAINLTKGRATTIFTSLLAQLMPLCALIYLFIVWVLIDGVPVILIVLHGLFCFLSAFIISLFAKGPHVLRVICMIVNSILLFFLLGVSFLMMIFGQMAQNTIIKQVVSPNASYTALVIDADQGALGGSTLVNVEYNFSEIQLGLGRFVKIRGLYQGRWMEFNHLNPEWEDDNTLLINGQAYEMDGE